MRMSCLRANPWIVTGLGMRLFPQVDGAIGLAMMAVLKIESSDLAELGLGSTIGPCPVCVVQSAFHDLSDGVKLWLLQRNKTIGMRWKSGTRFGLSNKIG